MEHILDKTGLTYLWGKLKEKFGINSVSVSVDSNTGTPTGSASISNGALSLIFQNLKGEKGDDGDTIILGDGEEYTLYSSLGDNTDGAITQKKVTELYYAIMDVVCGAKFPVKVSGANIKLSPYYTIESLGTLVLSDIPNAGYAISSITITMGGVDITSSAYSDGIITIDSVTSGVFVNIETTSVTDTNMFTKRTTGNGITILNDKALLKGIRGNTYDFGDGVVLNNCMANYISKDENENVLQNVPLDVSTLTGTPESFTLPYDSQVEYVDKSGTDDTSRFFIDYIPNGTDIVIKAKLRITGYANSVTYSTILGSFTSGKNQYRLARYNNSTTQVCGQMACSNYGDAIPFSLNEDHIVELRYGKTIVDGVEYANGTTNSGNNTEPIALLAIAFGRLYYCKVYKGDDLIADVIPVRIGDEAGFYDRVINKLCVKSVPSSTAWSVGQDVEQERLPIFPNGMVSPYLKQVEYVQKTSNNYGSFNVAYIPTGYDIKIKFKFNYQGWVNTGTYRQCFGTTRENTNINAYRLVEAASYGNRFYGQCGTKLYGGLTDVVSTNVDHEVELSFGGTKIDGKTYTASTSKGSANVETIKLFMGMKAKLYYFQVYKADVLVVDLIPVIDGNGEPNFYDRISKKLCTRYGNWDDMTLVVGADVEAPPVYDEIKNIDGVWKAIKRNNVFGLMEQEEVYVLDDQTIPTELTIANQGTEEILPTNGATPVTAPAIMEIQYGSIPQNNLLGGGLLGGMLGGSNNGGDSDGDEQEEEEETSEEE